MIHQINAIQGDITKQNTDAIVNAANRGLFGGSGVCGAIFDAAGYDDMTKACKEIGSCETGEAVITPSFKLPAKYVIHTVGPVYGQNDGHDAELLQSCYWTSLARAEENGVTSITFPLISTGIYGYPKEKAIRVSIDAIREYFYDNDDSVILEVNLCAWSDEDYCFAEALTQDIVTSADHRVVQAVAMRIGDDVSFLHPECVAKSWPQFWDIRSAI